MNCAEIKALMSDYYDAEIASDDRKRVAAHLADCQECSDELARFRELSAMAQRLPRPVPSQPGWPQFQEQLARRSTVMVVEPVTRSTSFFQRSWPSYRGLRPAIAIAAILLVAVGWFASPNWLGHGSHNLLAADIERYANEFQRDPNAAQQALNTRYDGERVELNEAAQRFSYQPAAASGLRRAGVVESMHLLKMPCCDCLQTVCRRGDGSRFVIFEYAEDHPKSLENRPEGMAQCRGKDCCLAQIKEQFAASWKQGGRQISVVGARDQAEVENLVAWLK